jgi:type III secretion system FlhB-like substrate exporter
MTNVERIIDEIQKCNLNMEELEEIIDVCTDLQIGEDINNEEPI